MQYKLVVLGLMLVGVQCSAMHMSSFEEGMGSDYHPKKYANTKKLKNHYEKYHFSKQIAHEQPLIPKIIHQIWIGGKVPEKFQAWMETWKEKHPGWEYKLWGDKDIASFPFMYPDTFYRAQNVGAKADIWRYEILYLYGGVYVDVDFEAVAPLDPLIYVHPFFAGVGGFDYINNAIIGAKPGHPVLRAMLTILCSCPTGCLNTPWYNTGPLFFTKQVYAYLKMHPEEIMIYPIRFFYPLPNDYRFAQREGSLQKKQVEAFFIPETFGVHYWAESWKE